MPTFASCRHYLQLQSRNYFRPLLHHSLLQPATAAVQRRHHCHRINCNRTHTSLTIFATTAALATLQQTYTFASFIGGIYNTIIVKMTEVWYKQVLEKQTGWATILDIGIGTAGELLLHGLWHCIVLHRIQLNCNMVVLHLTILCSSSMPS
jgi:hypothetical protein